MSRNLLTDETKEVILRCVTPNFTLRESVQILRDKEVVASLQDEYGYSDEAICNARWILEEAYLNFEIDFRHLRDFAYIDCCQAHSYTAADIQRLAQIVCEMDMKKGVKLVLSICKFCFDWHEDDDDEGTFEPTWVKYHFRDGSLIRIVNPTEITSRTQFTSWGK